MKLIGRYVMTCPNCCDRHTKLRTFWRFGFTHCRECGHLGIGLIHRHSPERLDGTNFCVARKDDGTDA